MVKINTLTFKALIWVVSTVCPLITAGPLWAQALDDDAEQARWYQVEILIFAHKHEVANSEVWRDDIALAYPLNWIALKDPNAKPETPEAEPLTSSSLDLEFKLAGGLLDTLDGELTMTGQPLGASEQTADSPEQLSAVENLNITESGESSEGDSHMDNGHLDDSILTDSTLTESSWLPPDLGREPFYLLPPELRALEPQANAIKRSYNYRLLFQAAWRQPVVDAQQAPSILISGGDLYGEHHELEGSLSLSVSRYLHLKTNLWFTRFVNNYGQERGNWPEIPIRPDQRDYNGNSGKSWQDAAPLWDRLQPLNDEYDQILSSPYIPNRIALVQQKRRMKSQEIHYIDHPNIGIVVLCTPYEVPEKIDPEMPEHDLTQPASSNSSSASMVP